MKTFNYYLTLLVLFFMMLNSCNSTQENQTQETEKEEDPNIVEQIVITKTQFENQKMKLAKLDTTSFSVKVKTFGIIDVPPQYKSVISTYFSGIVKMKSLIMIGQVVKKGSVLFTLENPDFIKIQESYLENKNRLDYLNVDFERQKRLAAEKITSDKKLFEIETEYKATKARYESLKEQIKMMNIDIQKVEEGEFYNTIPILAPISGAISQTKISTGEFLNYGSEALSIVNNEHLHLELTVYEKDFQKIEVGQKIIFSLIENKNTLYNAEVILIGKNVEKDTRYIHVHAHLLEDDSKKFLPGMYVEAEIFTDTKRLPSVPTNTIVNVEDFEYVLIKTGEDEENIYFKKIEVESGIEENGYSQLMDTHKFNPDDEFLIEGAFQLIQ